MYPANYQMATIKIKHMPGSTIYVSESKPTIKLYIKASFILRMSNNKNESMKWYANMENKETNTPVIWV